LNWDKLISPVAHQFDRDGDLNTHLKGIRSGLENDFNASTLSSNLSVDSVESVESNNANTLTYPLPTKEDTQPILKPTFGKHRPHVDAIFALAEGYDLKIYLLFIESLKQTGFTGDLVLSVSATSELKKGVEDYLRSQETEEGEDGLNVVGYTVTWTCYEGDGKTIAKGANEGVRKCALVDMYGGSDGKAIEDPREPRPVATARYELYWAWSLHYDPHSWMMLIDSRDAYFQLNPFSTVEREADTSKEDGLLYFFEVSTSHCGVCFNDDHIRT